MIISVSTKHEFIPKFNGNDKLPAADQIKVIYRLPSIAMKERLFPRRFEFGGDGQVKGTIEVDRKKVLKELVTDLINVAYKLEDDKDVKKVGSVDELFNAPPEFDALIDEIYAYLQDLLNRKVDEKN